MAEPWFTDAERRAMGARTLDLLQEAIRKGDTARAEQLSQRMYNEFLSQHDGYRNWVTALLSEIGERLGDAALDEIMSKTVAAWWIPNLETLQARAGDNGCAKAKMFAAGLRGHLQPMTVEEDDEKVVIRMQPCGSGGRLVLEGRYDGPDGFLKIAEPQKMTYGRRDFPVYCAHEAAMEQADIEKNGAPFVVVEPSDDIGRKPCAFIIYKNPDDIPDKYYDRLGLTRPPPRGAGGGE
jgi:hypothetical protein